MIEFIEFKADWCQPCKKLAPILKNVTEELDAVLTVIDVEKEPQKLAEYGVNSIPFVVVFRDGKQIGSMIGVKPKQVYLDTARSA